MAARGRVFDAIVPNNGSFGTTNVLDILTGTISIWFKSLVEETISGAFLSTSNAAFNKGFIFAWESGGFNQRFTFYDGTDWRFSDPLGGPPAFAAGWHNIIIRWVSGTSGAFFLDGVAVGTFTPGTLVSPAGETKYLCNFPSGGGPSAELAELSVYNSSLSNGNVAALFAGDSPKALTGVTPIGYWRMNATGLVVPDEMGGPDLTLSHDVAQSSDGPPVDDPPSGRKTYVCLVG